MSLTILYNDNATVSIPSGINPSEYTNVSISDGFEIIPLRCFQKFTNLVDITLPDTLTTIGDAFLMGTKVFYLKLPKNLKKLEYGNPFDNTPSLEHIDVDKDNAYFCSIDGILYSKDMQNLIYYPASKNGSSYIIPHGVINIGFASIYNAKYLKNVIIPQSVVFADRNFLSECKSLELITVFREYRQEKISISKYAFKNSNLNISDMIYIYSHRSCRVGNMINRFQLNYLCPFLIMISQ